MRLGSQELLATRRADGALILRDQRNLPPYPAKLTDKLEQWAARAPQRILFAQRDAAGGWRSVTYA